MCDTHSDCIRSSEERAVYALEAWACTAVKEKQDLVSHVIDEHMDAPFDGRAVERIGGQVGYAPTGGRAVPTCKSESIMIPPSASAAVSLTPSKGDGAAAASSGKKCWSLLRDGTSLLRARALA